MRQKLTSRMEGVLPLGGRSLFSVIQVSPSPFLSQKLILSLTFHGVLYIFKLLMVMVTNLSY